jgi:hypothetical protein
LVLWILLYNLLRLRKITIVILRTQTFKTKNLPATLVYYNRNNSNNPHLVPLHGNIRWQFQLRGVPFFTTDLDLKVRFESQAYPQHGFKSIFGLLRPKKMIKKK